ncbi:hypothetical protein F4782DRAFT_515179 [Xylaria castorea]|nr:hypothetical protein F4782DRAFT_515179 [Xylaria castorea]
MQYQAQWADDCPWPRRLLHIRSMTSYPWKPGNRYGKYEEPQYNAISYTWGRFTHRQKHPDYASTPYLRIKGIPWPIPRVNPAHFTEAEFRHMIQTAGHIPDDEQYETAEFVWLDVACIDQTYPRTAEYHSEVGRQALIFRSAQEVVFWLTTFDSKRMSRWWSGIRRIEQPIIGVTVGIAPSIDLNEWIRQVRAHLQEMRTEQWFSSLWTLQEAFICPDATLLCRDGSYRDVFTRGGTSPRSGHLKDLSLRWNDIRYRLRGLRHVEENWGFVVSQAELDALDSEIEDIGFIEAGRLELEQYRYFETNGFTSDRASFMANPFRLLVASHKRECWEETDRVRGIMQVFDLRLGESSPNAVPGKKYSLPELEHQLAAELLRKYPVSSQLMVQASSCPPRSAWRVSSKIRLMEDSHKFWRQIVHQGPPEAVEKEMVLRSGGARVSLQEFEGTTMAHFQGKYSLVETYLQVVHSLLSDATTYLYLDQKWEKVMQDTNRGEYEYIAARFRWLTERFNRQNLGILFLARTRPPSRARQSPEAYCDWGIGLVLCYEDGRTDVFQRLGVIIWDLHGFRDLMKVQKEQLRSTDTVLSGYEYLNSCRGGGWAETCSYFG